MQRRWTRILASIAGFSLVLSMLAACGSGAVGPGTGSNNSNQKITIEIGTELPTTGADASTGLPAENGAALAIQQANASNFLPGYTFVQVKKDDVGVSGTHDSTVGAQNITSLIGDARVAAIMGPINSSVALAELPLTNKAPIAQISPSTTNDCLTQNTPASECGGSKSILSTMRPTGKVTFFRTATLDQYQGAALASYAYKTKGFKTAYVIDDTEAYGVGLAQNFINAFKQYGGQILGDNSIKVTSSYQNVLTSIAARHPDVVFFGGNDSTGGITIRQQMARIAGLQNTPFMFGDGTTTTAMAKAIQPLGGGPLYGSVPGLDPSQVSSFNTFYNSYVKQFGQNAYGTYSAGGYDDTELLLQAIKQVVTQNKAVAPMDANDTAHASAFRQAVIDAVQNINYSGVTGQQTFDKNGDTTNRSISIYTIGNLNSGDGWKFLAAVNPS
jgi:branched-chain amino acid transport system substrate-binding protein